MGLDVIGILSVMLAILGVGVTVGGLALRGIGNLKVDLTKSTDELSNQLQSAHKELRDGLKGDIVGLRDRTDAPLSEVVETRVAISDRVARLEGRAFGMPLTGTGTNFV